MAFIDLRDQGAARQIAIDNSPLGKINSFLGGLDTTIKEQKAREAALQKQQTEDALKKAETILKFREAGYTNLPQQRAAALGQVDQTPSPDEPAPVVQEKTGLAALTDPMAGKPEDVRPYPLRTEDTSQQDVASTKTPVYSKPVAQILPAAAQQTKYQGDTTQGSFNIPGLGTFQRDPNVRSKAEKEQLDYQDKTDKHNQYLYEHSPEGRAQKQQERIDTANGIANATMGKLQERSDLQTHQNNLKEIKHNPALNEQIGKINQLDSALALVEKADHLTVQQINEFQQAVRSSLGISGGGSVGEREHTYLKSLGLDTADAIQFITGKPADISQNNDIVMHMKQLSKNARENLSYQFDKQLAASADVDASIYENHPKLKQDLIRAIKNKRAVISEPIIPSSKTQIDPASVEAELKRRGAIK